MDGGVRARGSRRSRKSCASRRKTPEAMPVFVYKAADRRGQTIDGVMDAPDARAVVERLQKDAYYPIKVTAHGERAPLLRLGGSRVRPRDLLALTQQLATLFEAGLPLDRALTILEELAFNARVKAIVSDLLRSVRGGASFSEALAKHHPRPFSRLYINMVRAGEKGGVLEVSLRRLAEFLEARAAFNEAVVSALAYPLVLTLLGGGPGGLLMNLVHPRFPTGFQDLGPVIPLPPPILVAASAAANRVPGAGDPHGASRRGDRASGRNAPQGRRDLRDRRAYRTETCARVARARDHRCHGGARGVHRRRNALGDLLDQRGPAMRRWLRDQRGFTLIELMVVIIVLGLLVGLVAPRLFGRVGQSKQAAAKAQIELLGAGLDQFRLDIGSYPNTSQGLDALPRNPGAQNWNGPHLKKAVPK